MNSDEKIKGLRTEGRMSMRGLARAAAVTPMVITNIEKGFTPGSSAVLSKITRALETDVDQARDSIKVQDADDSS